MGPSGEEMKCPQCGKSYKSSKWFNSHVQKCQSSQSKKGQPKPVRGSSGEDATSGPSSTSADPPLQTDERASQDFDFGDVSDEGESEVAAAKALVWDDWSGTDDDEEMETYCQLIIDPWREEEEEERRREAQAGLVDVDLDASKKKAKAAPPPLVKCRDCGSPFMTLEGYVSHRVGHGMQAAMLRLPGEEDILKACPDLGKNVCAEILESKVTTGHSKGVFELAATFQRNCGEEQMLLCFQTLCDNLLSFLKKKSDFLMPSALIYAYQKNLSSVLVNSDFRDAFMSSVAAMVDTKSTAFPVFVPLFTQKFAQAFLAYIVRSIGRGVDTQYVPLEARYAVTYQSTLSLDFKQNMHYIGGSNVKSIVRSALRVKHRNDEWHRLMNTLKEKFIVSDFAAAPEEEIIQWTLALDRGRLTKISAKALDFFVQLGTEVKPLERLDGSLVTDEVIDKVSNCGALLVRWDELKGTLNERESFKLLHSVVYHFCVTWRNGIIGRRHDEIAATSSASKFGTGGVSFRASLGGK